MCTFRTVLDISYMEIYFLLFCIRTWFYFVYIPVQITKKTYFNGIKFPLLQTLTCFNKGIGQ
jgi:hypothetical protein